MSAKTTPTPPLSPNWERFYNEAFALHRQTFGRTRCTVLVATVADWHNLTSAADFNEWDDLHTRLLDSILASEGNTVRINVTELEARHILAQSKECGLGIERGAA